jgi:molybdopterin synthase sulfur carrier subunit
MITVVFFASLREELGTDTVSLETSGIEDVQGVVEALGQHLSGPWYETLTKSNILIAVNQEMVNVDSPVSDGDEVAFLPPVTGG